MRAKESLQPKKLVIFLGAGASRTSGFPVGNELRLLLCNKGRDVLEALNNRKRYCEREFSNRPQGDRCLYHRLMDEVDDVERDIDATEKAIELFRWGGFGSVDEFAFLAQESQNTDILKALKQLTAFCLFLNKPERVWHESDYYRFVQKLFLPEDLSTLRDDVTVLTYNYDPYLEFVLERALNTRFRVASGGREQNSDWEERREKARQLLHGGWLGEPLLKSSEGFVVLKLHGTAAIPKVKQHPDSMGFGCASDFLLNDPADRAANHGLLPLHYILFPWEGESMLSNRESDRVQTPFSKFPGTDVTFSSVFAASWELARERVRLADKISFVGLSMHEYLNKGFQRLFSSNGSHALEVVVTSGLYSNVSVDNQLNDRGTVVGRVASVLREYGNRECCSHSALPAPGPATTIRTRKDFADFIEFDL